MNTERKIQDYLHFYLGSECLIGDRNWKPQNISPEDLAPYTDPEFGKPVRAKIDLHTIQAYAHILTPILRKLSDMTEEEWKKCFELSRGMVDQAISDKIKKMAHNEICVTLGYMDFLFGYHSGDAGNDVRIGHGLSFYLKSSLMKDELSVSDQGIETSLSRFDDIKQERVYNMDHIFVYLLSKGFDLFGLIESNLAINKSTLQP